MRIILAIAAMAFLGFGCTHTDPDAVGSPGSTDFGTFTNSTSSTTVPVDRGGRPGGTGRGGAEVGGTGSAPER